MRKDIPVQNVIDPVKKVFMDTDANKLVLDTHQVRKDIKIIGMARIDLFFVGLIKYIMFYFSKTQVTTPVILLPDNGSVSLAILDSTVLILASKAHLGVDVWGNVHARIMQSAIM